MSELPSSAPAFDLQHLTATDAITLGELLVAACQGTSSRQQAAERLVQTLFAVLFNPTGDEPACALVRCFQTCTYARLPLHYRDAADQLLEQIAEPAPSEPLPPVDSSRLDDQSQADDRNRRMRCLTLLATRGTKAVWNDVMTSVGHQAIPLPSVEVVHKAPMIARLLEQFGMPIERVVALPAESDFFVEHEQRSFNIFHVPQAAGSRFIPAQATFVEPYGVRSVLGIGGLLPDGELFAVVLFTRVPVSRQVAAIFGGLAATVQPVMLPFAPDSVFAHGEF